MSGEGFLRGTQSPAKILISFARCGPIMSTICCTAFSLDVEQTAILTPAASAWSTMRVTPGRRGIFPPAMSSLKI
eukprot:748779-Hanusia_phi.AAC.3